MLKSHKWLIAGVKGVYMAGSWGATSDRKTGRWLGLGPQPTIPPHCTIVICLYFLCFYEDEDLKGCCNNCPRDRCPRRQLSKGLLSNDTVVQADSCPRRLLSKESFTSEKLAQIGFSFFLLRLSIQVCYIMNKRTPDSAYRLLSSLSNKLLLFGSHY